MHQEDKEVAAYKLKRESEIMSFIYIFIGLTAVVLFFAGLYLVFIIELYGILIGVVCDVIGKDRKLGRKNSFWIGFFLGLIGLIIVLASERVSDIRFRESTQNFTSNNTSLDQILKLAELKEKGLLTEEEFETHKARLLQTLS